LIQPPGSRLRARTNVSYGKLRCQTHKFIDYALSRWTLNRASRKVDDHKGHSTRRSIPNPPYLATAVRTFASCVQPTQTGEVCRKHALLVPAVPPLRFAVLNHHTGAFRKLLAKIW